MKPLKRLFQENLVNPAAVSRGETHHKIAKVLKAYESKNECYIQYVDKDRVLSNKDSVSVKIYNPSGDNWFPTKGDIVTIEEIDGIPIITGMPQESYDINIRPENQLEKDIYSDNMSCNTDGGYII